MMGSQDDQRLPYCVVDLEQRVPANHPLRLIRRAVDFSFVRAEVAPFYGYNGNESVDPEVILKLLFLLFLDDLPSERELMRQVAYRLDYLWFLGMSLNDEVPDHSVLSKARARWGGAVFEKLFVRTVRQCVEAGLVDGRKVHLDASVVDADAARNAVLKGSPQMVAALKDAYARQEAKLAETRGRRRARRPRLRDDRMPAGAEDVAAADPQESARQEPNVAEQESSETIVPPEPAAESSAIPASIGPGEAAAKPKVKVNDALVCRTDPDAAVTRHAPNCKSGARPRYMSHRAVDDLAGVITAVASTPGDANEGALMIDLLAQHEFTTDRQVEVAVADSKYGTIENYLACEDHGIQPHMADLNRKQANTGRRAGIFPDADFAYDAATDTYRCPAGQQLQPARHHTKRRSIDYTAAPGVCAACPLKAQCTRSKTGRSIKRHDRQRTIDRARAQARSPAARRDRRRRMHLMEGSFADAAENHGLKRSRWRRLWRQRIQDTLIAAVQNVRILAGISRGRGRKAGRLPRRRRPLVGTTFTTRRTGAARDRRVGYRVPSGKRDE